MKILETVIASGFEANRGGGSKLVIPCLSGILANWDFKFRSVKLIENLSSPLLGEDCFQIETKSRNLENRVRGKKASITSAEIKKMSPFQGRGLGKQAAFTLAEVLITLGIIGVVAAMTISTVKYIQTKQLEVAFQKAYSTLLQAFEMYKSDNGEALKSEFLLDNGLNNTQIFTKYIRKLKNCNWGSSSNTCVNYNDTQYKRYDGINGFSFAQFYGPQFIMNDNQLVMIGAVSQRVIIGIDVNGYNKKPNRAGFDFFVFELSSDGRLVPEGYEGTVYYSSRTYLCQSLHSANSVVNGYSCSYYALADKNYFKKLP